MATVLRFKVFSALRNASMTCSFLKTKSLTNVRPFATALQENSLKYYQQMSIHQCLMVVENKINVKGRLTGFELDCIVQAMKNKGDLKSNQVLLLIRCCGSIATNEKPEVRMVYAQKVWNSIKASGIDLDISHYNAYLKVQIENEQPIVYSEYLKTIENEGLAPNRVTYQYLLTYCCLKGDLKGATELLEKMKMEKHPLNENIFNALVMGHCVAGDVSSAEGIMNIMREKDIFITSKTYSMLLSGLAISGNIEKMRSIMEECEKQNVELRGSKLFDVVYYLFTNGHSDYAVELLEGLAEVKHFRDLIILQFRLLHKKQFRGYIKTLKFISDERYVTEKMRLAFRHLGNKEDFETILEFKDICDKEGLDVDVMKNCLYYSLMSNNIDKSFRIIQHLHKAGHRIKESFFTPLIKNASENNQLKLLLQVINTMTYNYACEVNVDFLSRNVFYHLQLNPRQLNFLMGGLTAQINTGVVFNAYMKSCLVKNNMEDIRTMLGASRVPVRIFDEVLDSMVKHLNSKRDPVVIIDIIVQWVRERKREINNKSPETADNDKVLNDIQDTIDKLAIKICRNCENSVTENFLNVVVTENIPISTKVVDLIRAKLNCDTAEFPEANMNEEESRADEAESFKPQENEDAEKSELEQFMKQRKLGNVAEMLKLFDENENLQTHFVFRKVVETLKLMNKDDLVKDYLKKYYEKFSQQDNLKKNLFLEAEMVNRGMVNEALTLIGKRGPLTKSSLIIVMEMFISLFERGNAKELKEILNVKSFSETELINLQDIIESLIKRGSEEVATKLIHSLDVEDMNTIDLNKSLIPALFNKKEFELMEKLIKFLEENPALKRSGSELIFLYACNGSIAKGRELLDSELVAPLQWLRNMSAINPEDRVQVMENAIAILKGNDSFQKGKLYEYLMVSYDLRSESPEKALDLWLQLQEENVQPSPRFLYTLAKILKKNGRDVPFEPPSLEDYVQVFVPQSFPWNIKEAVWQIKRNNTFRSGLTKLTALVLENKLHEDEVDEILRLNENMIPRIKAVFDRISSYFKWKKAYESGSLADLINTVIDSDPVKTPEDRTQELPVTFLTSLLASCPPNIPYNASKIILWAHLRSYPEYSRLVEILEPQVQETIKSRASVERLLHAVKHKSFSKKMKDILTLLINQNIFDEYSDVKEEAEFALSTADSSSGNSKVEESKLELEFEENDFSFKNAIRNQAEAQSTKPNYDVGSEKPEEKHESADIVEIETRTSGTGPNL